MNSNAIADQAEVLLAELRTTRRRNLPFMALGVVAALIALGIMIALVVQNRQQAREVQRQTALAQQRLDQLNVTLRQIKATGGGAPQLVSKAIVEAKAANVALSQAQAANFDQGALDSIRVPPADVTGGLQLIATGAASGWDVDVFWCAGPGEADNYAKARLAGITLGIEAARQTALAPGIRLGRVRVRPVREQDRASWPAGFYAVSDGGNGEDAAADAVATFLTPDQPGTKPARVRSTGAPTPYYLSVFACN